MALTCITNPLGRHETHISPGIPSLKSAEVLALGLKTGRDVEDHLRTIPDAGVTRQMATTVPEAAEAEWKSDVLRQRDDSRAQCEARATSPQKHNDAPGREV